MYVTEKRLKNFENQKMTYLLLSLMLIFTGIVLLSMGFLERNARTKIQDDVKNTEGMSTSSSDDDPFLDKNIETMVKDLPTVVCESATKNSNFSALQLKDLAVKSAYNAALLGDTVSTKVLVALIERGVRAFDLQCFYQLRSPDTPGEFDLVVGYSPEPATTSTTNVISLTEAVDTLLNSGFSNSSIGNISDPLFIRIRLSTEKDKTIDSNAYRKYQTVLSGLKTTYASHFLDKKVVSTTLLKSLEQKVVFILDGNVSFDIPHEFFNMSVNGGKNGLKAFTYTEMNTTPTSSELLPRVSGEFKMMGSSFKMVVPDPTKKDPVDENPPVPQKVFATYAPTFYFMRYYDMTTSLAEYESIFGESFEFGILPISFILANTRKP